MTNLILYLIRFKIINILINFKRIQPDIGIKDKKFISLLCFSETSLREDVLHQGLYESYCGVNPFIWKDDLDKKGIDYNSLRGGLEVYKFYLKVNNGNKKKAILDFKGVDKNQKVKEIVDKILVIEKELR